MKYMGHKGKLLPILGEVLKAECRNSARVADPFCGSGAVSWFLAQQTEKIVVSGDLQSFAVARAAAVVERTEPVDAHELMKNWFAAAREVVDRVTDLFPNAARPIKPEKVTTEDVKQLVERSRAFCHSVLPPLLTQIGGEFPITMAYGGHYFSPMQAIELDALRQTAPSIHGNNAIAIAALVETASRCAAAPGHTAQPFQPTITAAQFIVEAWNRNVWDFATQAITSIANAHARVKGHASTGDYVSCINQLQSGDLVFADPPYSDVHYSRFYHVLETLARGVTVQVTGSGRYPAIEERPNSSFSRKGQSQRAARLLVETCAARDVSLVLTFPTSGASNGLTTADFIRFGSGRFSSIETLEVSSKFSTLGGNGSNRSGRTWCAESIICFRS